VCLVLAASSSKGLHLPQTWQGASWVSWQYEAPVEPATGKAAATSLSLGRDPGSRCPQGTGLGSSGWAGGSWPGMLEDVAAPNAP